MRSFLWNLTIIKFLNKNNFMNTQKRRKHLGLAGIILSVMVLASCISSCNRCSTGEDSGKSVPLKSQPLNMTVFLDLSDRLTREMTPTQMDRDTAIIRYVGEYFIDECSKDGQLLQSTDNFQILFYPAPASSEINSYAAKLKVNLSDLKAEEKKRVLLDFRKDLTLTTQAIYQEVLKSKNWTGCDVWRFFSDKKVDQLCMKQGYRNILIILTDGYLFETSDKIKEGNAYSYILPQTLKVPDSSLIVKRDGLENLEVLMLEVNPYDVKDKNKMVEVLETWFREMEVSKFVVAETDLPEHVKVIIHNFLT